VGSPEGLFGERAHLPFFPSQTAGPEILKRTFPILRVACFVCVCVQKEPLPARRESSTSARHAPQSAAATAWRRRAKGPRLTSES